ncbi:uncharacterized protein Cp190 [Epargyreus clarus]|uniref:uncharacterized protein Cp190 n=1 Tax=Epargyreus clarus TaxID=520877 RepID=UPI003C30BF77
MSDLKQVKVDNWGIFFLQRLKHFFNRTDYCDLTLQFQDNAQLKVHRLVLSACTEYFELLERTCEMYEDCLVMPDDLQADVVVPIVNFMYTGQLEFKMDLLERLYQTALVMNMPVLTKLLDAHRSQPIREAPPHSYSNPKRFSKSYNSHKSYSSPSSSSSSTNVTNNKRSYGTAFENNTNQKYKKSTVYNSHDPPFTNPNHMSLDYQAPTPKKQVIIDPRPTRYELPEELEADNLFDNSFTNISYTSKPLMVHPETTKHYGAKRSGLFEDPSTSKTFIHGRSTIDIVECKKISDSDHIFNDDPSDGMCDQSSYPQPMMSVKHEPRDSNQLFDQILDGGPKVTIETKDTKQASNLDHAKIISEVLKKYPHLVKSNKNIKLKILNTPAKKKPRPTYEEEKDPKPRSKSPDFAFETDVIDSKEAAKLIALGAENIKGPWICLLCGAPGKAIHFSTYYKFRRHLVEVHNEKPILNICEYCGQRTTKRNHLLHHLYSKHGIEPPPQYKFPKCNVCNYIALTERYLIKHKLSHGKSENFRCYVCNAKFSHSNQLLIHIQKTGHKYSADRKANLQCIYCLRVFLRESNLYAHIRTNHKESAKNDGVIDMSDDEKDAKSVVVAPASPKSKHVKYEVPISFENESDDADVQYQIQQQPDGNIQVVSKKPRVLLPAIRHKILNSGFSTPSPSSSKMVHSIHNTNVYTNAPSKQNEFLHNSSISIDNDEEIVMIDNNEYVVKNNNLIPKRENMMSRDDFFMPDMIHTDIDQTSHQIIPTTSIEYTNVATTAPEHKMIVKKSSNVNQPIQIVVSNEEEYKALISSNHSIIFEDGDPNKTLTVLTTPNDNNIETTIDLNNTQENDMMIIPDDYPMNVSEAVVPGNNSNIVVVYSHPVDDQNKEYQLISSQNLETQFVTTSGIITQNYETVTTSAPVMSAHVIETPAEDSWQNTIPETIVPDVEMEIPISSDQVTITPMESEQTPVDEQYEPVESEQPPLDKEQEEQVPPMDTNAVEIHTTAEEDTHTSEHSVTEPHIDDNLNETNTIAFTDDTQPDVVDNSEAPPVPDEIVTNTTPTSNSNDVDSENISEEKEITEQPNGDLNNGTDDTLTEENKQTEDPSIVHETESEPLSADQNPDEAPDPDMQNINSEESSELETVENIAKEIQSSANTPSSTEINDPVNNEPIDKGEVSLIKAKEQIKNLTSEWSDDEMETASQEENMEEDNLKNVTECEAMETDSQPDVEESIENIQQEMKKQMARTELTPTVSLCVESLNEDEDITSVLDNENVSNEEEQSVQETEPVPQETESVVSNETSKTPDKISSLLNDWEDNDSQEEDIPSAVENKEDTVVEVNKVTEKEMTPPNEDTEKTNVAEDEPSVEMNVELPVPNTQDTKAGESIKSLVSDWVEEDEETESVEK